MNSYILFKAHFKCPPPCYKTWDIIPLSQVSSRSISQGLRSNSNKSIKHGREALSCVWPLRLKLQAADTCLTRFISTKHRGEWALTPRLSSAFQIRHDPLHLLKSSADATYPKVLPETEGPISLLGGPFLAGGPALAMPSAHHNGTRRLHTQAGFQNTLQPPWAESHLPSPGMTL